MKVTLRPVGLGRTIDEEILAVESSIDLHQRVLEDEGVWLFLAVLGCWSVSPELMRIFALCLALVLFGLRYARHTSEEGEFSAQFAAARVRIRALASDDATREDGLDRLATLEKERLGGLRPLYKVPSFLIGWTALYVTLMAALIVIW